MINRKTFLINAFENGFKNNVSGYPLTLKYSKGKDLLDYKIYGNSVQESKNKFDVQNSTYTLTRSTKSNAGNGIKITAERANSSCFASISLSLVIDETYTISFATERSTTTGGGIRIYVDDTLIVNSLNLSNGDYDFTFTAGTTNIIYFYGSSGSNVVGDYSIFTNVQLENGSSATPYVAPYPTPDNPIEIQSVGDLVTDTSNTNYGKYKIPVKVNDVITNIYLDEPLRKVGTYSDYIDFKNKKVIRNIKKKVFTGNETYDTRYLPKLLFSLRNEGYIKSLISPEIIQMCNYGYDFNASNAMGTYLSVNINKYGYENYEDFINILKEKNNVGKPVISEYILSNPTEETIELPDIPTLKYTNIITTNTTVKPSNMIVEYKSFEKGE